jgi:hypothetical protein
VRVRIHVGEGSRPCIYDYIYVDDYTCLSGLGVNEPSKRARRGKASTAPS